MKYFNISKRQALLNWTTTKVNCMLKYQSLETLPRKSLKSRKSSLISKQIKLITFKRLSKITANPNQESI